MIDPSQVFLDKAQASLAGARVKLPTPATTTAPTGWDHACFQAAVAALLRAASTPRIPRGTGATTFVPGQFVGQLITRRKLYPAALRDTLPLYVPVASDGRLHR